MEKKKRILGNTIYTIAGALVINGVLQLIIYPSLTAEMGEEAIGSVLYITGLVSILGPSVGQALNTGRLVVRRDHEVSNGDYDSTILLFSLIGIPIALFFSRSSISGASAYALTALVLLITIFRYYGDCEYRLNLNYRRYFIYYLLISLGYLAGYLLYRLGADWFVIFILGETAALVYVGLTGSIFRGFFRRTANFKLVLGKGAVLVLSYLVTNTTLNIDRLVLKSTLGGIAVTRYYVLSLIGKTLVLFIAPVNTIIISYLTKDQVKMNRQLFLRYAVIGLGVSAVFFGLCQIGTPIFIRLFYPDLYESVKDFITVVNLTQILSMLSAYLFIIVLTFTGEKWQLRLQCAHLAVSLLLIALLMRGSLLGFSWAMLIANTLRIAAVLLLGFIKGGKDTYHTVSQ